MVRPPSEAETMSNDDSVLTRAQLAARLKVQPGTIGLWTRRGRIPVRRLSPKVLRYDLAAVLAALDAHPKKADGRGVDR
jgi:predicted site-specific integrase-resolvase